MILMQKPQGERTPERGRRRRGEGRGRQGGPVRKMTPRGPEGIKNNLKEKLNKKAEGKQGDDTRKE